MGASPEHSEPRWAEDAILYRLTDALFRAESAADVFDAALDAITTGLGDRASILLFDKDGVMRFVAWRGLSDGYRTKLEGHSPWTPADRNPEPILVADIAATDEPEPVKATILTEGIRGLAFIPLVARGHVIGKFMTYFADAHVFSDAESRLAVTIARQLGFAIEHLRAAEERQAMVEALQESERRFRQMAEQAPVMIWTSDTNGHCLSLNRSLRAFWGVAEDAVATFDWRETMHPDDIDHIGQAMMQATVKRESVVVSGRYRKADGSWRILRTEAHPRFSRKGRFLGMIGVNVDTTETEMAQAALRERQERLRVALAAGRMGTWRHDMRTGEQDWDERQYELFGVDRSLKPTRALFLSLVHPDDLDKIAFGDETFLPDRFLDSEFRIVRPDGETRWITAHSITRNDAAGQPIEMIGVNFDTTERRETEDRLRLLLDELKHRVKNTLAVVQAIAHQTFRERNADPAALRAFEGRLIALANAHNLLTSSDWESALLSEIASDALRLQGIEGNRFALGGPLIILPAKHALAVALALHELCTNALKHGALSNDSGRVELTWQKADPPRPSLSICWRESGGPRVRPPAHRGFGTRLIETSLAHDLDAQVSLDFVSSGLVCTINARLH